MALQLDGNIKNYNFVRSAETKGEVEIQDSVSHDVLFKKIRQMSTEAYHSQIIDPIPEVILVEVEGRSSKDKLKKVKLYQPDDVLELKDTGILGFEHKFTWEGEVYVWRRRNLGFSREIECKMVHGDDPGIGVAIFKPEKKTIGHMTIMYYNLERIGVEDKRGLEYVLLITMFSFLDKSEDENSGKKKNEVVDDSNVVIKDESKENKKKKWKREKKRKSSESKEATEKRLAEEKKREMEKKEEEERLRAQEVKQQETLRILKQEKEDQEYARKLLVEEDRISSTYNPRDISHNSPSSSANPKFRNGGFHNSTYVEHQMPSSSPANQQPRNGDFHNSTYMERQMPSSSLTDSRNADSTGTVYPSETGYSNTYYDNPVTSTKLNSEDSKPVTPIPKRKKKPREYKNEYGW
ncbi:11769_t:CDS:2 [Acaulospora morrowiae]|uniref:11769_t:CDS:1 n=1 Tax=Acaulospora morrowiae TaxID=94023 RepID=A0A9N8Z4U1_9GLOM|nr:11769_t:CDS:2 [Acaulospora morrowiae]